MKNDIDELAKTQSDGTPAEHAESVPPQAQSQPVASAPPASVAARFRDENPSENVHSRRPGTLPLMAPLFGGLGAMLVLVLCILVGSATRAAGQRLSVTSTDAGPQVAIADQAEVAYCTPQFKEVLERVLHACGLEGGNSRHGCQPSDVKSFASISDDDFNALFHPLKERGAVLLFDNAKDELDESAKKTLEERYLDRRGARYFFAVARASKVGNKAKNRALSHRRANSVKFYVQSLLADPDLDKKFGQLWLGDEFAQLPEEFCSWPNSRTAEKCGAQSVNRSVFVSWVDCRL